MYDGATRKALRSNDFFPSELIRSFACFFAASVLSFCSLIEVDIAISFVDVSVLCCCMRWFITPYVQSFVSSAVCDF